GERRTSERPAWVLDEEPALTVDEFGADGFAASQSVGRFDVSIVVDCRGAEAHLCRRPSRIDDGALGSLLGPEAVTECGCGRFDRLDGRGSPGYCRQVDADRVDGGHKRLVGANVLQ